MQAWPFCPCGASARDLVADMLGVALGLLLILAVQLCCGRSDGSGGSGIGSSTDAQSTDKPAARTGA